jgi:phenylalanyl-tRNA synthetase beta chain
MIVSWNWLKQYVPLDMPVAELERRLMMAGLNHEGTAEVGGDLAIDLEVTSNRPDCLGHIGIAREAAVLWGRELKLPAANPPEEATPVGNLVRVRIACPDLCLRYTARVVRGVKIGPSPAWMVRRLKTVGITPINNVVDISNYVLMECGQPLHTFDFGKLEGERGTGPLCAKHPEGRSAAKGACPPFSGAEIIVRRPLAGETIEAIDHKTYVLGPEMCMICDARRPVAIGGVMGGAQTEISPATRDILVESAEFEPVSIRNTARILNLHSDSSYRFQRRVDPEGLDWASRRCCELILELAGGKLAAGVVDVGQPPPRREPIVLRFAQLKRILGIDVPPERVREILVALGNVEISQPSPPAPLPKGEGRLKSSPVTPPPSPLSPLPSSLTVIPPSWRRDLTREIDLVEEVGRIHGYDAVPEDVSVPMVPSARRRDDRVLERIRQVLLAAGFDEAVTPSAVDEQTSASMSPWTDAEPLRSQMPVIRGAACLRRSLVPSLLSVRRTNEALANAEIELFEIARVYLPRGDELPQEELMLGITSGREYPVVRGVIEAILDALKIAEPLDAGDAQMAILDASAACRLRFGGEMLGYAGQLHHQSLGKFDLRGPATVAEIRLAPLVEAADLVPRCAAQSPYPAVTRDLNLVVDESVRWADLAATVRAQGGPCFESLDYRQTYRDPERLGNKKSLLFTISLRSAEGTLTSQQADEVRDRIVAACRTKHGAELRT